MILNPRLIIEDNQKNSKLYPLSFGTNLIGRSPSCKVCLENDKKISREHCALVLTEDSASLVDLESGNGTFFNASRIEKASLQWGDRFIIGSLVCLFVYDKTSAVIAHESSATITHIPSSNLKEFSNTIGGKTTLGVNDSNLTDLFYQLAKLVNCQDDLSKMITDFLNYFFKIIQCESIGFRFRGHQFIVGQNNLNFEFVKIPSHEVIYNENTGILIIPLPDYHGVCQIHRVTGFTRYEIETFSAILYLFDEICFCKCLKAGQILPKQNFEFNKNLLGKNPTIKKINDLIQKIGDTAVNVLISGQSGTGKEVVAQLLHKKWEGDSVRPFVAVNCAAVQSTLFESEFFGHVKGAFTNANENKTGYFEQAHGGTLFLDELGEMPIEFQAKLLRVIETGELRPVGGNEVIHINVRIICATNRDLKLMISEGKFREDLFYRLQVIEIKLPSLKDRKDDIPLLVEYFINQLSAEYKIKKNITAFGLREIQEYDWPGNIRELKNFLIKVYTLTETNEIDGNDVRMWIKKRSASEINPPAKIEVMTLEEAEMRHIIMMLKLTNNNKAEAAKILGITRSTLYEKIKKIPGLQ